MDRTVRKFLMLVKPMHRICLRMQKMLFL